MTIKITKFGDSYFDVDAFDYSRDSDSFPGEAATDFENVLLEVGEIFQVIRQTTTVDGMGVVSAVSESEFRIYAYIQDISKKDRMVHEMGLAVPGNRILYLKPSYTITSAGVGTEYIVKEGDIFIDRNSYKWRVIKIFQEPYIGSEQVYKKAVVRSIGLEGSG